MKRYFLSLFLGFFVCAPTCGASYHFANFTGHPPIHVSATTGNVPKGMTPDQIKKVYGIPQRGGKGTIVIIGAYDATDIEKDLQTFDTSFSLSECTSKNGCLTKHLMSKKEQKASGGWALETALDIEWAHAIAPNAKIVLVEAATPSGANLLNAIEYADMVIDAIAISMSWGGAEFPEETSLDAHFKSVSGAQFFASSGDSGAGTSWPAASPNVIAVGGTSLKIHSDGTVQSETAWRGSGGGVSQFETSPPYQNASSITRSHSMRAIPDVAYNADPATGFPVVHDGVWRTVGGTSAGAPQWAAIASLGKALSNESLYALAGTTQSERSLRDITSGTNGTCGFYCTARKGYDYVTGIGTPRADIFK